MPTNQGGSWLNHQALMLMKGIGATATDNLSAENPIVTFNLMTEKVSLTLDGWTPQIPAIKNGGVWSDSPISDGRQLLAAPVGNLTEKMTIIISDTTKNGVMVQLVALNQMMADVRDYWQGIAQIDPVYLMWWANCGAGPQYALLYNIELAPEYLDSPIPSIRVSMTLEREPYWRGLPPGANPKLWAFYVNNQAIGLGNKVLADATLVTGSDHLINVTINNKAEWTPAAFGLQSTFITKNFIDITAAQVPGDAPALVEMSMSLNTPFNNIYVGRTTKKQTSVGHDGITRVNSLILNTGDSAPGIGSVKTVVTNATGVLSNGSAVNFTDIERTVTGIDANYVTICTWGTSGAGNLIKLDRELFRGTFAVFCRAENDSAAPVVTDMKMRILIYEFENNANQYFNIITLPDVNVPAPNATIRQLSYMGTVTIPFSTRAVESALGYGLQIQETTNNLRIDLQQQVLVGTANRIFKATDLVFIPIDEGMTQIALTAPTGTVNPSVAILDNAGYLTRGEQRQVANSYQSEVTSGGAYQEVRGQDITLKPRTNQRLYFIWDIATTPPSSNLVNTIDVRLNIVPRWSGIRDV